MNGSAVVLKDGKVWVVAGLRSGRDLRGEGGDEDGKRNGYGDCSQSRNERIGNDNDDKYHSFQGFYIQYPLLTKLTHATSSPPMGLVSSIPTSDSTPALNWLYIDRVTQEMRYANRTGSMEHVIGPWGWDLGGGEGEDEGQARDVARDVAGDVTGDKKKSKSESKSKSKSKSQSKVGDGEKGESQSQNKSQNQNQNQDKGSNSKRSKPTKSSGTNGIFQDMSIMDEIPAGEEAGGLTLRGCERFVIVEPVCVPDYDNRQNTPRRPKEKDQNQTQKEENQLWEIRWDKNDNGLHDVQGLSLGRSGRRRRVLKISLERIYIEGVQRVDEDEDEGDQKLKKRELKKGRREEEANENNEKDQGGAGVKVEK